MRSSCRHSRCFRRFGERTYQHGQGRWGLLARLWFGEEREGGIDYTARRDCLTLLPEMRISQLVEGRGGCSENVAMVVGWLVEVGVRVTGDSDCVGLGAEIWFMGYRSISIRYI